MEGGLLVVWYTDDGGYLVQLLWANVVLLRRELAGGGTEPTEGAGKMGTTGEYFGKGGGG